MTHDANDVAESVHPGMDLRERRLLADLETSGRLGTPVEARAMPFTIAPEEISRAIISGPPRYATRRRRIEATIERLLVAARDAWHALADQHHDRPDRFAADWLAWLADLDVVELNRLIDANNRYYPIEARLRVDIRTGNYITFDGRDFRYPAVTAAWLALRFPADLATAQASHDGG
jgi:hypothetical protein